MARLEGGVIDTSWRPRFPGAKASGAGHPGRNNQHRGC